MLDCRFFLYDFSFGIEEKMKKVLFNILISCFSLTFISCFKKNGLSRSGSNIQFCDVKENLSGWK